MVTRIAVARDIAPTSWLHDEPYRWLLDGLRYAETQTRAIPALAASSPEEIAHAVIAVMRGAGIPIPHEIRPA